MNPKLCVRHLQFSRRIFSCFNAFLLFFTSAFLCLVMPASILNKARSVADFKNWQSPRELLKRRIRNRRVRESAVNGDVSRGKEVTCGPLTTYSPAEESNLILSESDSPEHMQRPPGYALKHCRSSIVTTSSSLAGLETSSQIGLNELQSPLTVLEHIDEENPHLGGGSHDEFEQDKRLCDPRPSTSKEFRPHYSNSPVSNSPMTLWDDSEYNPSSVLITSPKQDYSLTQVWTQPLHHEIHNSLVDYLQQKREKQIASETGWFEAEEDPFLYLAWSEMSAEQQQRIRLRLKRKRNGSFRRHFGS